MIKYLLKGVAVSIATGVLTGCRHLSVRLIRIEAAKAYLHGVRMARVSVIGLIGAGLVIGLIFLGILLFHAGLFILLPWTLKAKALLGACLGLVYAACGIVILRAITDEKVWMEKSGAARMLKDVTGTGNPTKETER